MSGFAGWMVGAGGDPRDRAVLDAMAMHLSQFRNEPLGSRIEDEAAVTTAFDPVVGSLSQSGQVIAAIEGYPTWEDQADATMASASGNAAALIALYRRRGDRLFEGLRGPFAFVILDCEAREAILAVDRFGVYDLCYSRQPDRAIVFSTSLGGLTAFPGLDTAIDPQSIFDFFYFIDRIPAPRTVYRRLEKLPPGYFLHFRDGRLEQRRYWRMSYRDETDRAPEVLEKQLVEHLERSVQSCIRKESPQAIGAFLSGGLDSSTVLGLLSQVCREPPKSFTIGFDVEGFDESAYASIAAEHFGARQHTYYLSAEDVIESVAKVAEIYDEPFANSSALPAYFCALQAKRAGVDLLLAGDGGDELFAGNSRYLYDRVFDHYALLPAMLRQGILEPLVDRAPWLDGIPVLRKVGNYVRSARLSVAERLCSDNIFRHFSADQVFAPDFLNRIDPSSPLRLAEEIFESAEATSKIQRMMYLDLRLTLADSDLRKVGRMCELAGIRVKFPFLDDELAEFSAGVPARVLMRNGALRGFYKEALKELLPGEILSKPKKGFGLPYTALLASHAPLNELACDSLRSLKARAWFAPAFLDEMIRVTRSGEASQVSGLVWDLMVLELWLRAHAVRP